MGNPHPRNSHIGNSSAIHRGQILTNMPELLMLCLHFIMCLFFCSAHIKTCITFVEVEILPGSQY
jgi:hypothetical protein